MTKEKRIIAGRLGGTAPHAIRTHWTRGKRRNDPGAQWAAILRRLIRRLKSPVYGRVSVRACAAAAGVDQRTLRMYLSGKFLPSPETAKKIETWLDGLHERGLE